MTVHPAGWPFGRPTRVSTAAAILVDSLSVRLYFASSAAKEADHQSNQWYDNHRFVSPETVSE